MNINHQLNGEVPGMAGELLRITGEPFKISWRTRKHIMANRLELYGEPIRIIHIYQQVIDL